MLQATSRKLRKLWLKYVVGYNDPLEYWNKRWQSKLYSGKTVNYMNSLLSIINELMMKHDCQNILEVGCGMGELRSLPNYLGCDFSSEVLEESGLEHFIHADITSHIPLPNKSQDAVFSRCVLLHIPFGKIEGAVSEISRVAVKLVILREPWSNKQTNPQPHCFTHDLPRLFREHFNGKVVFLDPSLHISQT